MNKLSFEKSPYLLQHKDNPVAWYPWGEAAPTCELANFGFRLCRDPPDTTEVGSLPMGASPYGALDMAGNVIEWVHDWYQYDYFSQSPTNNPTGPNTGEEKVVKGGSWYMCECYTRPANRDSRVSEDHDDATGFRLALDAN